MDSIFLVSVHHYNSVRSVLLHKRETPIFEIHHELSFNLFDESFLITIVYRRRQTRSSTLPVFR